MPKEIQYLQDTVTLSILMLSSMESSLKMMAGKAMNSMTTLSNLLGTRSPMVRSISDSSMLTKMRQIQMDQSENGISGPNADGIQKNLQLATQISTSSPMSLTTIQSATPPKLSSTPSPVTSSPSCASSGPTL